MQTLGSVAIADPRHLVEVTKIKRPPTALNRLLALRIRIQNLIFERFELLLNQQIETFLFC
ncbi:hypothetical protein [uncultured Nostoc sp.]|uniref:hypothetical protein n=1 Tax=uncultured Nostoc sp. TaxID=340711 RepID=UPI002611285C|nr:hypothetical protein [uncultured Nostoc sp.]